MVGELSTAEVSELKAIAPELGALLAASHPARAVTRNLFRLSRLASQPVDGRFPRTEVDMAEQWWQSAGGALDALLRERARVLKDLAEQTLDHREPLQTTSHPAPPVDALVLSQTLRDLAHDRVEFHHDVLRDWAIANLLYFYPDSQDRLPLDRPAPASLVRGVELAARMALERGSDDSRWKKLLDQLSQEDAHGSWRRAVLLAPAVRKSTSHRLRLHRTYCLPMRVESCESRSELCWRSTDDPHLICGCQNRRFKKTCTSLPLLPGYA